MPRTLCLLLICGIAHAAPLRFVDEWTAKGQPAYGQATAALTTVKPEGLKQAPPGAQYAVFSLKGGKSKTIPLIVAVVATFPGASALYVDGNRDGVLTPGEIAAPAPPDQRPPGFGSADRPVWIARLLAPLPRTVVFRLSAIPGMIVMAMRGYAAGSVTTAGGPREAIIIDANANLVLDRGADTLYADLNGDGRFDPSLERRPVAACMDVGGRLVRPALGSPLERLAWQIEPGGDVWGRFVIGAVKVKPERVAVGLYREGGGAVLLDRLGQPTKLPAGDYTIESIALTLPRAGGTKTYYTFGRSGQGAGLCLRPGGPSTFEVLGKLTLTPGWSLQGTGARKVTSGATLRGTMDVRSASGLSLAGCDTATTEGSFPTKTAPKLELLDPSRNVVFSGAMSFG